MKPIFDLVMETADLYSFLLNVLIDVYSFSDFDIADEQTFFHLEFSKNSCIRQYVCVNDPSIKIDGMHINIFQEEKDVITYKTSLTTNLAPNYKVTIKCASLGYKDGFKLFKNKQDVLDECLRLENAFVKSAPKDLVKTKGECSICNIETTLLEWPCHHSHTICEQCTNKILKQQKCVCPFCRSALPTTFLLKEEKVQNEDDEDDEEDNEDYYIHYYDYYLDDEEDYFRKHK